MRHIFATKFCDVGAMDGNLRLLCLWISWGWELAWIGCSVRSSRRWRCDVTLVNTNTLNHSLTMEHGLYDWKKKKISNAIYWTFANFKDFLSNILFSALVCCSPLLGAPRLPCGGVCTCKGGGRDEEGTVSWKGFLFLFVFVFVFVLGRGKNTVMQQFFSYNLQSSFSQKHLMSVIKNLVSLSFVFSFDITAFHIKTSFATDLTYR